MLNSSKKRGHYKHYNSGLKLAVINEIETSGSSIMDVSRKYAIGDSTIRYWLKKRPLFDGESLPLQPGRAVETEPSLPAAMDMAKKEDMLARMSEEELRAEVLRLQKELKIASLRAEALDVMIDIAERQEGIRIRKKSGAKQS